MGLDSVELVMMVEMNFGIDITDAEAADIYTVGDFHAIILEKLNVPPASPRATLIWQSLQDIIVEGSGAKRDQVVPGARIVKDLGIN